MKAPDCRLHQCVLNSLISLFVGFASHTASAAAAPDLTGVVKSREGPPIRDASVFIYTAGPREGVGIYCPSCYVDCRKSTHSTATGDFKIESLDPKLVFEVLVVAPGFTPTFFKKVDPAKAPLTAELEPRSKIEIPPSQIVSGRVVNAKKEPVVGAVVSVNGTTIGNTTYGRPPKGTDPLAVTDEKGEFAIRSPVPFDSMGLIAEARAYAKRAVNEARPGPKPVEIVLTEGAALMGRVVHEGKPVKGVAVGLAQSDRAVGSGFTGDYSIGTEDDGTFAIVNLPPDCQYDFYGVMSTLQPYGAIPDRKIQLKSDGSTLDLRDVMVVPGHRLAGRVKLSDDALLPTHTQLMIGREGAWDSLLFDLPSHGRFDFAHVPAEQISVGLRVPGYRLSARNASLSTMNPFQLVGRLETDKTNLTVLLEPGEELRPDFSSFPPEQERPENLPLGGIELLKKVPNGVTFAGRVLDAATQTPVPQSRVTPGYLRNPTMKDWIEWGRAVEATNGEFTLEAALRSGSIVLKAEADGYLPAQSASLDAKQTKWEFRLLKGSGPKGVAVLNNGQPAERATVVCLAAREQASLDAKGKLSAIQAKDAEQKTSGDGAFEFAPKLGPTELVAASDEGFARVTAEELQKTGKIALQPWARIHGRLVKGGRPVAGEHVDLSLIRPMTVTAAYLNLHGAVTDNNGRFAMDFVPPVELHLNTRVAMGENAHAWTPQSQRQFTPKPGADLDLGEIEKTERQNVLGFGR